MSEQRRTGPNGECSIGMSDVTETNDIKIDFSQIPEHVRDELASSTIEAVNEFLRQPGGREFLDKKKLSEKQK